MENKQRIAAAIAAQTGLEADQLKDWLETPPDPAMGDYAFPCFRFAKTLRMAPPKIAQALAEAFDCGVNDLPLSMVLSWYEQKAVCILLTLLHLGIKNIRLGPTLPAFVSPNVLNYLVENFGIAPITTPEEDLKQLLK